MTQNTAERVSSLYSKLTLFSELALGDIHVNDKALAVDVFAQPYFQPGMAREFQPPTDDNLQALREFAITLRLKNGKTEEDAARMAIVYSQSLAVARSKLRIAPEEPNLLKQLGPIMADQRERIKAAMAGLTSTDNILKPLTAGDSEAIKAENDEIFIHNMAVILLGSSIALPEEK